MTNKLLEQAIEKLILDDGYTSYNRLPYETKVKLTVIAMEDNLDWIYEGDILPTIKSAMLGNEDSSLSLKDELEHIACKYFYNSLLEDFTNIYDDIRDQRKIEGGLTPIVDSVNGETRWVR